MPKAVIYCRVSTKEQTTNHSLPTQEKSCIDFCKRNEIEVDRIFVGEGESAKNAKRKELQNLIKYCQAHRGEIDFVVFYSINRFSRDVLTQLQLVEEFRRLAIRVLSATETNDDNAGGRFTQIILGGVAQYENELKGERTIAGMKAAIIGAGSWPFPVPLGLQKVPDGRGHSRIEADPLPAPFMTQAFELYATGRYQREQVLKIVTAAGLRTKKNKKLSSQSFSACLKNPIYAGILRVPEWDVEVRGNFTPLVSESTFEQVQRVLTGRRPTVTPHLRFNPDFPLKHFVKCASCNRPLTASWVTGRGGKKYSNFCCKNG